MKARFILSATVAAVLVWAACESDSLLTTSQDDVAVQLAAKKKLTREQKADRNGDGYVCTKRYQGRKRTRYAVKDNSLTVPYCGDGFTLICHRSSCLPLP